MTLFFTFFYTAITFNPDEVADNMKKYGGFIPGYRAGRPTAEYLRYVINRITSAGALYLVIIALLPSLAIIPLKLSSSQMRWHHAAHHHRRWSADGEGNQHAAAAASL